MKGTTSPVQDFFVQSLPDIWAYHVGRYLSLASLFQTKLIGFLPSCSGGFYSRNDGKTWILTMLLTATLFPTMCLSIAFVLNSIAIGYHSLAAVPFGTILIVLIGWIFISFPLCLFGTVHLLLRASPYPAIHVP